MNVLMKYILASLVSPSPHVMPHCRLNPKAYVAPFVSAPALSVVTRSSQDQIPLASSLAKSLKAYRNYESRARVIPASSVMGDKLISTIAAKRPDTLAKLQAISGIGQKRIVRFGMDILKLISLHKQRNLKKSAKKIVLKRINLKKPGKPVKSQARPPAKTPKRPRPRPRPRPTQPRPYGPRCAEIDYEKPAIFQAPSVTKLSAEASNAKQPSVYILELEQGRVYIGTSRDVEKRVAQHFAGGGAAFTRVFKPTGMRLPRLGNVTGNGDAAERDETLRYMFLRGTSYVRGWKYTQVEMTEQDSKEAESNIRELYDLCRRCGGKGHFISQCRRTEDRLGNALF